MRAGPARWVGLIAAVTLLGGCVFTGSSSSPGDSATGATGPATSAAPAAYRGTLTTQGPVAVARGDGLKVSCGSVPLQQAPVAWSARSTPKTVDTATRVAVEDNVTATLCPGHRLGQTVVAQPPEPSFDLIRYRVFVEMPIEVSGDSAGAFASELLDDRGQSVWTSRKQYGKATVLDPIEIGAGQTATWEVDIPVPADGKAYGIRVGRSLGVQWSARSRLSEPGVTPTAEPTYPVSPDLPAALVKAGAGATQVSSTLVVGPTAAVPHRCGGAAPTKKSTFPDEMEAWSSGIVKPGEQVDTGQYLVTVCDEGPYTPSPAAFPAARVDYGYKRYSAIVSMTGFGLLPKNSCGWFNQVWEPYRNAKGGISLKRVPETVRVADPGRMSYCTSSTVRTGDTVALTFVVGFPKSGGPYYLSIGPVSGPQFVLSDGPTTLPEATASTPSRTP